MEINAPFGISYKSNKPMTSSHKVLPANRLDKDSMLIRPITSNNEKMFHRDNDNSKAQVQYINYSPIKKKSYLQTLKDKIFSPGDFIPTKNESKNQKLIIELSKKLLASSTLITKSIESQITKSKINSSLKFLPEKSYYNSKKKTLILDLDETLVHSAFKPFYFQSDIVLNMTFEQKPQTIYVLKRPHVDDFLEKMSKLFEIVIFTASIPEYANPLLDQLDQRKRISYRLFREHCTPSNSFFIKDLKKVGRDLKDTIIIDNNPVSYLLNKENGIPILTWHSSKTDNELMKLVPLLEYLSKVDDVRNSIKKVINGNFVNFREVNKLISSANEHKESNKEEEKNAQTFFGLSPSDFTSPSIKKKKSKKEENNLNTVKKKIDSYYFEEKDKKIGDKIRENFNINFDSNKKTSNNLFEDKVYQEKYNQFYETKSLSNTNTDFFKRAYETDNRELVLPSNNCRSSSKNIKSKKFNNIGSKNLFSSTLTHNESYHSITNDKDITYTYRQSEHHLPIYVSPLREKHNEIKRKENSLSRSLERKFNLTKINKYTTPTATISLQDKANDSKGLNYLSWNLNSYNYKSNKSTGITKRNLTHTLRERLNNYTHSSISIKPQVF